MKSKTARRSIYVVLLLVFLAHNDFWLWNDGARVLGLPVGLLYHVAYCGVASLVLWWVVASTRGPER